MWLWEQPLQEYQSVSLFRHKELFHSRQETQNAKLELRPQSVKQKGARLEQAWGEFGWGVWPHQQEILLSYATCNICHTKTTVTCASAEGKCVFDPVYVASKQCQIKGNCCPHCCSTIMCVICHVCASQFQHSTRGSCYTQLFWASTKHPRKIRVASSLMSAYYLKRFGSKDFSWAEVHYCIKWQIRDEGSSCVAEKIDYNTVFKSI